jgi:hypothetical protein
MLVTGSSETDPQTRAAARATTIDDGGEVLARLAAHGRRQVEQLVSQFVEHRNLLLSFPQTYRASCLMRVTAVCRKCDVSILTGRTPAD